MKLLLTIEDLAEVDDGFGDDGGDRWESVGKEWFKLDTRGGREFVRADRMESEASHMGRCHYFSGAHAGMRLRNGSRVWEVKSVQNEREANRWLVWELKEI